MVDEAHPWVVEPEDRLVTAFGSALALTAWADPEGHTTLASGGTDGTIRRWNATTGTPIGNPLTGHTDTVSALTTWTDPEGHTTLASGGTDGTIRRWNTTTGTPIGNPLTDTVWAVTTWTDAEGHTTLASAGDDGTIQRWNTTTGTPIGTPIGNPIGNPIGDLLTGHTGPVWALTTWTDPEGHTTLASASGDSTIRRWNTTTGTPIGNPLTGHTNTVSALTAWTDAEGHTTLASASNDGTIRRWNTTTGTPIGDPLTGYTGPVWALTAWADLEGHTTLASTGQDGTIRVWDAVTGEPLHRVFVEPIGLHGLADRPAVRDLLGRNALTQVLANLLSWRPTTAGGETGPSVVACEGPWGAGKTSIMRLVRDRIEGRPVSQDTQRHISVADALKLLREASASDHVIPATVPEYRGSLTAWFNPWTYQSSDQVWAGLARSIVDAAKPVLFTDEAAAHRYWLARNVERIDRFTVRRQLMRRMLSPVLGFSVIVGLATVLINFSKVNDHTFFQVGNWRLTPSALALAIGAVILIAGLIHTALRYHGRERIP